MFGVVLGVDPGVSRCGYGAVRREGATLAAVAAGVIRTPTGDPLPDRLATLEAELETLVSELSPDAVAVERLLFQHNTRTAMAVGQASGLVLAVAARAGLPIGHYSPNEVKLGVVGHGGADKAQVQTMVARLLGLGEAPRPPDAADALALAICHAWRLNVEAPSGVVPGLERAIDAAVAREGG